MTELWKHQQVAVERARQEPHLAIFHDPGLGKTRSVIEALREDFNSHKRVSRTLIICPLSTCRQWRNAWVAHSKIGDRDIAVLTGDGKKRTAIIEKDPKISITNFEGVQIKAFYAALLKWSPEIVVIDESHRLRDSESVRAGKIYPLCLAARRRFILSGTPILNSLLDIFGQYKALDPTLFGSKFWNFKRAYFYDKNANMPRHLHFPDWKPLPTAARDIAAVIAKTAVHAKKSECLDLPDLVSVTVPVDLSPGQRKAYESMEKEFVAELGEVTSIAEFAMTKTLRLQQILAGFVSEAAGKEPAWFDDVPRLTALKEILEKLEGQQVIVWTNFKPTYAKIGEICAKMNLSYVFLTGEQSIAEKEQNIQSFVSGETRVIISNPSAGGTGVDGLQAAPFAVYFSRGYSAEHFWQSRDRNHRGGSEIHDKITHYHLVVECTIDEVILAALSKKESIAESVVKWAREKGLTHTLA